MREYPAPRAKKKTTRGKETPVYLSEGAKHRLSLVYGWIKAKVGRGKDTAQRTGIDHRTLGNYVTGRCNPSLWGYLQLMELFNFNCELDINYVYATMKYSREEIRRRVIRITPREELRYKNLGYSYIAKSLGLYRSNVYDALTYQREHSLYVFVQGMYFISRIERRRGYEDAMIYEV